MRTIIKTRAVSRRLGVWLSLILSFAISAAWAQAPAADSAIPWVFYPFPDGVKPWKITNFGPTGLGLDLVGPDFVMHIREVFKDSPAAATGQLKPGQIIERINGRTLKGGDPRILLGNLITEAEAKDGVLRLMVKDTPNGAAREVVLRLPALGPFSKTWPLGCAKTRAIIRANADYIARVVEPKHDLYNALAILMLLSTGEEKDLEVVRKVYAQRMAAFSGSDTGPHSWHNGYQGIAVCEYYLRTGDASVMPLINAICESARKYQVHGGWTHWNPGVNPQYVAGGLMNPAGTQLLTTLLLAKQCGAKVDDGALLSALHFFYRFAGHGSNPYGDHRPEWGFGSNNGKTEMLAAAMQAASRAIHGEVYALARDKSAHTALYNYPNMFQGHSGPAGIIWYGIAAAFMNEKRPELYRNRMEECRWFYELSRRHDGAFGIAGGERYDDVKFGFGMGLSLTAPMKTLQITGAPPSKYARPFDLPKRPWGREADLVFLQIDGGPRYGRPAQMPVAEWRAIEAADEAGLERFASHPEHVYRERTAHAIRAKKLTGLIERLLVSDDPRARHTACMAINGFEPWNLRSSIGVRSANSLAPEDFTPVMFDRLMAIITNPKEALWNVNNALLSLAAARPEQIKSRLSDILPWLDHEEWWLYEAACIALAPAMSDPEALDRILPPLVKALAATTHQRVRDTVNWFLKRATETAPPAVRERMARAYLDIYRGTPSVPSPEAGVDYSGITSVALYGTLESALGYGPDTVLEIARLSVQRLGDMRPRERNLQLDSLIAAADKLKGENRLALGELLVRHYRPLLVGGDSAQLRAKAAAGDGAAIATLNKILQIDRIAGRPGGWKLLGNNAAGEQEWWHTSNEPEQKPPEKEPNRYRALELPPPLRGWFQPDYDPAARGWIRETARIGDVAPSGYRSPKKWHDQQLPKAGEVIFTRKTFALERTDYAIVRVIVFAKQGYDVYLNGQRIAGSKDRPKSWGPHIHYFDAKTRQHLRKGTNVIAASSFLEYSPRKDGNIEVYVEGLEALPPLD